MEDSARCQVHSERVATGTCGRCGRFGCEACMAVAPCLECRVRAQGEAASLHPAVPWVVVACLLTNAAAEALALPFDAGEVLGSSTLLVGAAVLGVLLVGVWLLGIVVFLVWFVWALQRGVGQGAPPRSLLAAVLWWFVPGPNLVIPWLQLRAVFRGGRRELIDAWWVLFACTLLTRAVNLGLGDAVFPLAPSVVLECLACVVAAVAVVRGTRFLNEHEPTRLLAART
ncbi:MAG: DUF4328 domain-containing protein [Myxococcaceae bacterium]|nr:DUF4328 domain-containing protein [Myxococcaceae bacterium]